MDYIFTAAKSHLPARMVLVLGSKILQLGRDVNPIGIVKSSEVQINHSTLYQLKDELVGASEGVDRCHRLKQPVQKSGQGDAFGA